MRAETPLEFWVWLARGHGGNHPGWRRVIDRWLLLDGILGFVLALLVPVSIGEAARATLLPLAGIFVGMSFAWVGSAQAIAQSEEIDLLSERNPDGFEAYVYPFQLAILGLLTVITIWGIASMGVFEQQCWWRCPKWTPSIASGVLFALASIAIRLCWRVVLGSQMMLLYQRAVRRHVRRNQDRA